MKLVSPGGEEDDEAPVTGLGFGVFEYAVIKTAHLGLCQVCSIQIKRVRMGR